ncbi:MAG: alginate export family protein [Burkholderiaceae bacterium]|jgi:alginate production protein|nr:alginate export family protein [Burkholderiaceae bacterium]MEB2349839.1 alginate export family protein [Burkholderiaceae bacterium]
MTRRSAVARAGGLLVACVLAGETAAAQLEPETDPARVVIPRVQWLLDAEGERNFELERDGVESAYEIEPALRLSATIAPGRRLWGYVETEWLRTIERESGEPTEYRTLLRLNQAYAGIDGWLPDTRLRLGRWLLRDEREWLFDENFDGVHARYEHERWQADALLARVNHWQRDLLDIRTRDRALNHTGLIVRRDVGDDAIVGTYAVDVRRPGDDRTRRTLIGVRAHADPDKGMRHWVDLGVARGNERGKSLRGRVVDAGITLPFEQWALRPRLTLGYAMASGDDRSDDRVDRGYRQTGVQSNEGTFGGLAKFRLYGETLDPELHNLHVVTLGVGLAASERVSVDAVFHGYRQDATGRVRAMNIDPDHDRRSTRTIGQALDLVVGWRPSRRWRIEFAAGWFRPSMRFAELDAQGSPHRSADAWSLRFEVDFRY